MVRTTKAQQVALANRYYRGKLNEEGISYRQFRKTVQPTFGCDGAVVVYWREMWLCIERDGYCHT